MTATTAVNVVTTDGGKLRPVCEFCGCLGEAVDPGADGRISMFDVAPGWSVAPFPADFVHADGSTGSQWCCPEDNQRLRRGESLFSRAYMVSEPETEPDWVIDVTATTEASARAVVGALALIGTRWDHSDGWYEEDGQLVGWLVWTGRTAIQGQDVPVRVAVVIADPERGED